MSDPSDEWTLRLGLEGTIVLVLGVFPLVSIAFGGIALIPAALGAPVGLVPLAVGTGTAIVFLRACFVSMSVRGSTVVVRNLLSTRRLPRGSIVGTSAGAFKLGARPVPVAAIVCKVDDTRVRQNIEATIRLRRGPRQSIAKRVRQLARGDAQLVDYADHPWWR